MLRAFSQAPLSLLTLTSGKFLTPDKDGRLVRLNEDGREDASFQPPFNSGFTHPAEAKDATLWTVRSNAVLHLSANGTLLTSTVVPWLPDGPETADAFYFLGIQPNGRLISAERQFPGEFSVFQSIVNGWLPDGSPDPTFEPIVSIPNWLSSGKGSSYVNLLSDGRIVLFSNAILNVAANPDLHVVHGQLWPISDQPGRCPGSVTYNDGQIRIRSIGEIFQTVGDVSLRFPASPAFLLLTNLPKTSLQTRAVESNGEWMGEGSSFSVEFRRLGSSAAPATLRYTTRDITAIAGKDYLAQSGALTFAPFETEKTVAIPILEDDEKEFDETLEVVVTSAEGFELLPTRLRLTILASSRRGLAPRLERVKRLRDGRVLLGGNNEADRQIEFSSDLKTWQPLTNLLGGITCSSGGIWLDASATNADTRFYRAVAR